MEWRNQLKILELELVEAGLYHNEANWERIKSLEPGQ